MSRDHSRGRARGAEDDESDLLLGSADDDEAAPDRRSPRRSRRIFAVLGVLSLLILLAAGGTMWWLTERYAGNVDRIEDVFTEIPEAERPAPPEAPGDPVTFLLVGSDSREQRAEGEPPGARSDAIMLARITGDREHAQLISIPRDSWVDIPGHGKNKINASYAFGGPSLLIQTVEQLTGVRIDHFAVIDFDGLIQVTDDLGGVEVVVAEETANGPYTFPAGVNRLDGDKARWYLAQRYGLPGGDFDRVRRQQQFMKAIFGQLVSRDTFSSPTKLDATLRAVTSAVSVDEELTDAEMLRLAYSLRDVQESDVQYLTAPVLGTGTEGRASVVYLDETTADRMWQYLRTDSLAENAAEFAEQALPEVPR